MLRVGRELHLGNLDNIFTTLRPSHLNLYCSKTGFIFICANRPAFHQLPTHCINYDDCNDFMIAKNIGKFSYEVTEKHDVRINCEGTGASILELEPETLYTIPENCSLTGENSLGQI